MKVTLCLMVRNELNGCKKFISEFNNQLFDELIAIDGNSSDGTAEFLSEHGFKVIIQKSNGYNAAYNEAFENFNTEAIVFFHPKGTISANSLLEMLNLLKNGNELVIASRMLKDSWNEEDSNLMKPRKWLSKILSLYAYVIWSESRAERITDPLHGFRGMSRDFVSCLRINQEGVTADIEVVKYAYQKKARCTEFPIREDSRKYGKTNFPLWKTGMQILSFMVKKHETK